MSPRIPALSDDRAPADARHTLTTVGKALGMVPNLHRTLANAPAALDAYVAMANALGGGTLNPRIREALAIASAADNGCTYCASAHTTIGRSLRIPDEELARNLEGRSSDARTDAALALGAALREHRGRVPDGALADARAAGLSDAELVEIATHVGLNLFTNLFNEFARTEVDFPEVALVG